MSKKKLPYTITPAKETRKWIEEEDLNVVCRAWEDYGGDVTIIEAAIGALIVGRLMGYRGLRLLHSWRTLKKYEGILGIEFAEVLEDETPDTRRLNGIRYAENFKAFWKALAAGVGSEEGARDVGNANTVVTE